MMRLRTQRGATLVIALVMLILLTLFALSALNTSTTNLKVVGNMQAQTEAFNAGQAAIESVISTTLFTTSPANAVTSACGAANTLCVDYAGSWVANPTNAAYTIRLNPQPACVTVRAIKLSELTLAAGSADNDCTVGQAQQFGVAGAVTGDSLCANSVWEITAETIAAVSGAKVVSAQGIGIRIATDAMATSCL